MTGFELGWVVGLIEGEGYIGATARKPPKTTHHVAVVVSSTDRGVLERVRALTGIGTIGAQTPNALGKKVCYDWRVQGIRDAQEILRVAYPHLSSRRQAQADAVLAVEPRYGPDGIGRPSLS